MFKEREDEPGAFRKVPHSELVEHGPAALDGTMFQKVTKHTEDMDLVPDAYVAFAGYAGHHDEHDMCTRSLYKRALEQDDPVRHLHRIFISTDSSLRAGWILSCQTRRLHGEDK